MYSIKTIEKLVFKVNSFIHAIDSGESGILDTECKGLHYDTQRKMYILSGDVDLNKSADYLFPLLANLEECVKYGDTEKFFVGEVVRHMKWATKFFKEWNSVEEYHKHEIHSLP